MIYILKTYWKKIDIISEEMVNIGEDNEIHRKKEPNGSLGTEKKTSDIENSLDELNSKLNTAEESKRTEPCTSYKR